VRKSWGGILQCEIYFGWHCYWWIWCLHVYSDSSLHYSTSSWVNHLSVDCPDSLPEGCQLGTCCSEHTSYWVALCYSNIIPVRVLVQSVTQSHIRDSIVGSLRMQSGMNCVEEALNWFSFHWSMFGCHWYSRGNASEHLERRKWYWKRNDIFFLSSGKVWLRKYSIVTAVTDFDEGVYKSQYPDWHWVPPSHLFSGYHKFFPRG
jgi:hypothetical protein